MSKYSSFISPATLRNAFERIHGTAPKDVQYYVDVPKALRKGKTPEQIDILRRELWAKSREADNG
jgi:hypothetical protein